MKEKDKRSLLNILDKYNKPDNNQSILVGFDGFLDYIIKVVDKRYSKDSFLSVDSIPKFASKIKSASFKNTNIELYTKHKKIGGNSVILSNSLTELDIPVHIIGAMGKKNIHPIFNNLVNKCKSYYSISDPGETRALEFKDGKIMLGELKAINKINYESITSEIKESKLINLLKKVKVVSFLNWTMIIQMNSIIENFIELFEKNDIKDKYLFFDLADFSKRTNKDLSKLFKILKYRLKNYNVILGLNKKEAEMVYKFITNDTKTDTGFEKLSKDILKQLNLDILLIHSSQKASVRTKKNFYTSRTIYNDNPAISTGAGDHFNAGFLTGILKDFPIYESLLLAVLNASYYVSKGKTGKITDLSSFINN